MNEDTKPNIKCYNWRKEDILRLIELWRENGVEKFSNEDEENIFEAIAEKLQARGIQVRSIEIKEKIQELTEKYKLEIKTKRNKSDWEYFKEVHAVFSNVKIHQNESTGRRIIQKRSLIEDLSNSRISNIAYLQNYLKSLIHPEEFHKTHIPVKSLICEHSRVEESDEDDPVNSNAPIIPQCSHNEDEVSLNLANALPALSEDHNLDKKSYLGDGDSLSVVNALPTLSEDHNVCDQSEEFNNRKINKIGLKEEQKQVKSTKYKSLTEARQATEASPVDRDSGTRNIRRSKESVRKTTLVENKILDEIVKANQLAEMELTDSMKFTEETHNLEKKRLKMTEKFIERSLKLQGRLCGFLNTTKVKEEND